MLFYDCDQIESTDCNLRRLPVPRNEEDEPSGKTWCAAVPRAVFPEPFGPCLLGNPQVREVFMTHHADLLGAAFRQGHKHRIQAGHVHDVFPHAALKRFNHAGVAAPAPTPEAATTAAD